MEKLRFRLTMYKYGKHFLSQSFDSQALAIKQGQFFMSASNQDHAPRGYVVEDTHFHNFIIAREGDTIYED